MSAVLLEHRFIVKLDLQVDTEKITERDYDRFMIYLKEVIINYNALKAEKCIIETRGVN